MTKADMGMSLRCALFCLGCIATASATPLNLVELTCQGKFTNVESANGILRFGDKAIMFHSNSTDASQIHLTIHNTLNLQLDVTKANVAVSLCSKGAEATRELKSCTVTAGGQSKEFGEDDMPSEPTETKLLMHCTSYSMPRDAVKIDEKSTDVALYYSMGNSLYQLPSKLMKKFDLEDFKDIDFNQESLKNGEFGKAISTALPKFFKNLKAEDFKDMEAVMPEAFRKHLADNNVDFGSMMKNFEDFKFTPEMEEKLKSLDIEKAIQDLQAKLGNIDLPKLSGKGGPFASGPNTPWKSNPLREEIKVSPGRARTHARLKKFGIVAFIMLIVCVLRKPLRKVYKKCCGGSTPTPNAPPSHSYSQVQQANSREQFQFDL